MAMYFHGNSEVQRAGGLQTLILMNPSGYVGYHHPEAQTQPQPQQPQPQQPQPPPRGNFVLLNHTSTNDSSLNPTSLLNRPPFQKQQQFVGKPLQAAQSSTSSQDPNPQCIHSQHISSLPGIVPRNHYNMYCPVDLTGTEREISRAQQGLYLSLSSQQSGYGHFGPESEEQPSLTTAPATSPISSHEVRVSGGLPYSVSGITNVVHGMQSMVLGSKYLKAAQQLLDEVANLGKGVKNTEIENESNGQSKIVRDSLAGAPNNSNGPSGGEASGKSGSELTTTERREIQMNKTKLINMLDEVEQRFRQYHHQMQVVISLFEQAAGIGSATAYTALASQTISKKFRCLKDAILGHIREAGKNLGEEDCLGENAEGSKIKFISNQIRQQKALQQLGMTQHNAWRPQRGLPERSVSVLRAWLFEHFLHPYPKDSDKIMLAKQTGLTRSQVSNWFINARVRLWKPMVEEMYMEEMKGQEQNGSEDNTRHSVHNDDTITKSNPVQNSNPCSDDQNKIFKQTATIKQNVTPAVSNSVASTSPAGINIQNQSCFNLIGSSTMESFTQGSPKKPRSTEMHSPGRLLAMQMGGKPCEENNEQDSIKYGNERQNRDEFMNFMGGFGSYPIAEIGRFSDDQFAAPYSGNGVSLTLGLPHCENISMSGAHQTFLPNQSIQLGRRIEVVEANEFSSPTSSYSTNVYENINIQNGKRFTAQLLPDFVT